VGWIGYVIPVWGPVQKSRDLALFCCAMGLRLRSGAALPDALRAGRDSVYNRRFRRLGEQVLRRVEEGESLSTALYYLKFFPKTMAWGISLGEENGELPRAFDTFAELYTAQMERSFEMVFQVLTPLGILAIGNLALVSAMMVIAPLLEIIQVSMNLSYR
jgi:type II secretory pathway component PulF